MAISIETPDPPQGGTGTERRKPNWADPEKTSLHRIADAFERIADVMERRYADELAKAEDKRFV